MAEDQGRVRRRTFRRAYKVSTILELAVTQSKDRMTTWAIIGGGNGGQSAAAHLALQGFPVRIYDVVPETIEAIRKKGGIDVEGVVEGFGPVELATLDMNEAVDGADVIMIIAPALYHRAIATKMAPALSPGQIVFIHPGSTFGAVEFRKVFVDAGVNVQSLAIAEAQSLLYACRAKQPGNANIIGMKQALAVAAMPAAKTEEVVDILNLAFPQMYGASNVLETGLTNLNAMMHPAPSLLNVSMIESEHEWEYYLNGITPTIGAYVERLDEERLALGKAVGLKLLSVREMYTQLYGVNEPTLSESVKHVSAYKGIKGQKRIETRYILEDIPMGLIPMASLGKQLGIDTPIMNTTIQLGTYLLNMDFYKDARTMESLGMAGLSTSDLVEFIHNG
jgi:opine dehydrogenase